ncbi:transporter [Acinetobacter sp. AG3]|jgi:hypothetical protein|uniref:transporter n=1 Tax=Acinetobacter sp. AG3 TaxID=2912245 RepID=UPI001EF04707|nr:transporter [Acinetobacter sp. AG3]MCG7219398.1 transporter [Acinetobacter sp. AG3]
MKKIILVLLFVSLVFYVSKNKSDINFESMEASENRVNDPCANADCTPDEFNSPYYKIPYEKLRDLEFLNYGDFGVVLLNNGILNSEVLKEYNFKDKDNSNYIDFENEAMLTINPNPSNGKVKSIDYDFSMCSSISSIDIDRIRKILKIFQNNNLENSFFKFDFTKKNNEDSLTNTSHGENGIIYEISCNIKSEKGQFHIYKK